MIKKSILLTAVIVFLCFGQEIIDGIAAIVGEHVILKSDVEQYARMTANQYRINPYTNKEQFEIIKDKALQNLIDEKILLEQAKIESIEVKDRNVEAMLEQQMQNMVAQAGGEDKVMEIMGKSIPEIKKEYRDVVRNRLIVQNLQQTKFMDVTISRREVENFKEQYKDSIPDVPPSLDFSHILIKPQVGDNESSVAKQLIDSLHNEIQKGADFGELAMKFSEDFNSAKNGGELGFIERGNLVKSFEEAAFQLEKGEISDVVKSEFGYHIIQMIERKGEKINVRHILIQEKISDKNVDQAREKILKIYDEVKSGTISFDSAAVRYSDDVDLEKTKGRIRRIPKNQIENPEFVKVLDNLEIGEMSDVFKTEQGFHIIRLNNVYDDTYATLRNWAKEMKKQEYYEEWVENLRKNFVIEIRN
jgi:peptidyl-prolyl cis-trans isomerase SurA